MIPPEPEPEPDPPTPPEPTVPVYTYSSVTDVTVSGFPGKFYTLIKDGEDSCSLDGLIENVTQRSFRGLLVWVNAFDEVVHAFCWGALDTGISCILDVNSEVGLTVPLYEFVNGTLSQTASVVYISGSTPSDYYDNIVSGNYTLNARSLSKGDVDESDLYDD